VIVQKNCFKTTMNSISTSYQYNQIYLLTTIYLPLIMPKKGNNINLSLLFEGFKHGNFFDKLGVHLRHFYTYILFNILIITPLKVGETSYIM